MIPMSDVRPTVSRSDVLAGELIRSKLDASRIAGELVLALRATMHVRRVVSDAGGVYSHHEEIEVPDWKTRLWAIKVLIGVFGYEFQAEKMQEGVVPRELMVVYNDMRVNTLSIGELRDRHRRDVVAGLVEEVK